MYFEYIFFLCKVKSKQADEAFDGRWSSSANDICETFESPVYLLFEESHMPEKYFMREPNSHHPGARKE